MEKGRRTIKIEKKLSIQISRFTVVSIGNQYEILKKLRLNNKYMRNRLINL